MHYYLRGRNDISEYIAADFSTSRKRRELEMTRY